MSYSSPAIAAALLALGAYAIALGWGRRKTLSPALLGLLVAVAALFHTGALARDEAGALGLRLPPPHIHEFFHYYLGSKYFREVGYFGLYDATVIADAEDVPEDFRPAQRYRDLRTNRVDRSRGETRARAASIKAPFDEQRWEAFKSDVALLRNSVVPGTWLDHDIRIDHGYNATPVGTLVLGTLANQPLLDSYGYLQIMRWMDLVLLGAVTLAIASGLGAAAALTFAFFWLLNPLNEYMMIGGAYLRYNFALALALATLCYQTGRPGWSGAWLALATGLRGFPLLFAVGIAAADLLHPDRCRRLRAHLPFYTALAACGGLLLLASALVRGPDGQLGWSGFRERIAAHSSAYAPNSVGWQVPFAYTSQAHLDALIDSAAPGEAISWDPVAAARFEDNRWAYVLSAGALLALTAFACRRIAARRAFFLGLPLAFLLLYLSQYYWTMLALTPLVFWDDRRVLLWVSACLGVMLVVAAPVEAFVGPDLRFLLYSLALGAMLAGALWLARSEPATGDGAEGPDETAGPAAASA